MNFSMINEKRIPESAYIDICMVNPDSSTAFGNRCNKEAPNSAPVEKLTMYIRNFFNLSSFIARAKMATKDIILTIATLPRV